MEIKQHTLNKNKGQRRSLEILKYFELNENENNVSKFVVCSDESTNLPFFKKEKDLHTQTQVEVSPKQENLFHSTLRT